MNHNVLVHPGLSPSVLNTHIMNNVIKHFGLGYMVAERMSKGDRFFNSAVAKEILTPKDYKPQDSVRTYGPKDLVHGDDVMQRFRLRLVTAETMRADMRKACGLTGKLTTKQVAEDHTIAAAYTEGVASAPVGRFLYTAGVYFSHLMEACVGKNPSAKTMAALAYVYTHPSRSVPDISATRAAMMTSGVLATLCHLKDPEKLLKTIRMVIEQFEKEEKFCPKTAKEIEERLKISADGMSGKMLNIVANFLFQTTRCFMENAAYQEFQKIQAIKEEKEPMRTYYKREALKEVDDLILRFKSSYAPGESYFDVLRDVYNVLGCQDDDAKKKIISGLIPDHNHILDEYVKTQDVAPDEAKKIDRMRKEILTEREEARKPIEKERGTYITPKMP